MDEQGTEAATVDSESASPPVNLTIDRPFLFAIYDQPAGQMLFFGSVVEP